MRVTLIPDHRRHGSVSERHVSEPLRHALDRQARGVAGGADYYLDKVANSVDDYYLGRGEAPGQWVGADGRRAGTGRPGRSRGLSGTFSPGGPPTVRPSGLQVQPGRRPGYDLHLLGAEGRLAALGVRRRPTSVTPSRSPTTGRWPSVIDHLSAEACFARRGPGRGSAGRGQWLHRSGLPPPHQPGR